MYDYRRKKQKIKKHCNSMKACVYCKLCDVELNCWDIARSEFSSDEDVGKLYDILTYGAEAVTRNVAEASDEFICEQCGIHIEDFVRTVYDEESEDTTYKGYEFKFCPECEKRLWRSKK